VSAEALGATVASLGVDEPLGGTGIPFIREAGDIDRIPPPDPGSQGRYPLMLEALDRLVKALGHSAFIVACFDQYPFSLAAALMGLEALLLKCRDDRSMVEALMNRCLAYGLAYGRALGALGADLLSGGDSPAGLVGPAAYREVAWPFEQRLVAGLKATTEKPVSLHICGNATPILGTMASTGADVLEIDHRVDLAQACQAVGSEVALWGNLDPVGLLAQGTPAQVRELTRRALDAVRGCGHWRFVLSSGCTLAPDTPPENLDAMFRMADEYEWPAP
jgi:MtaA/CmuA family methyltransferase